MFPNPLQTIRTTTHHLLHGLIQKPTRLTKKSCVSLLENCKSMQQLQQIQCQLFVLGLHHDKDALNKLMAFLTVSEPANLRYAELVFDRIKTPSLFIYNVMIRGYAKNRCFENAVFLYHRLREESFSPDNFTFPMVLKAIGNLRAVSEGGKAHGFIIKTGFEFDCFVRNSLVDMYAEMGMIDISHQLFDEMPERDVISWNVMISGYVKSERFEDAIAVFRSMEQEQVTPDEATLVSTLSACTCLRNFELGKQIYCYISEKVGFSVVLGNALLDTFSKCGYVSLAHQFFHKMPAKNLISLTTMVSGYVNSSQVDDARKVFDQSPERDIVLWTAMINGYTQSSRFNEALDLFRQMQILRIKPDRVTVVTLLTACAHLGALEQGKWIHGYIEENRIRIDAVVGTALVDMYAKCGFIEKSIEIFRRVGNKDTALYSAMICGLSMNGQTSKALEMFVEMECAGVKPDNVTFIGVLSACSHGGLVDKGRQYFESMKRVHHIEPKLEHYGCLVDLLGRAGLLAEAEELIQKIPIDKESFPLWIALLSSCRVHGNVGMGVRVAKDIVKFESENSGTYTLLSNIYAAADQWEDVTKVRKKMKDLGVKKTPGCSLIEVDGIVHEFLVGDATHPKMREIYHMLNVMAKPSSFEEDLAEG